MAETDTSNMSEEEIVALQKQNCIFCKIASKEIPAKILHEDDKIVCVLDINPASEGHILIFPKEHYMILPHIPEDLLKHLFKTAKLMSKTLLKSLQTGGTSIFIANGMAAGQKAPHVLLHVFPRRGNDGLLKLPNYEMNSEQSEKLKHSLNPYFNQLFGTTNKSYVKSANENKNPKIEEDKEPDEPILKEKKEIKKRSSKDHTKKKDIEKDTKQKSKVDLDDIAKLFG